MRLSVRYCLCNCFAVFIDLQHILRYNKKRYMSEETARPYNRVKTVDDLFDRLKTGGYYLKTLYNRTKICYNTYEAVALRRR